jgi:hypothetical protein
VQDWIEMDDFDAVVCSVVRNKRVIEHIVIEYEEGGGLFTLTNLQGQEIATAFTLDVAMKQADMYLMGYGEGYDGGSELGFTEGVLGNAKDQTSPAGDTHRASPPKRSQPGGAWGNAAEDIERLRDLTTSVWPTQHPHEQRNSSDRVPPRTSELTWSNATPEELENFYNAIRNDQRRDRRPAEGERGSGADDEGPAPEGEGSV